MADATGQITAMRRKAGVGRPAPEIGRMSAPKVLRAAFVQAVEEVAGLVAVAGQAEMRRTTLTPFTEALPEAALMALIEGPEGRFGLMVLDVQMTAALIEVQTTGRVASRAAPIRAPTRTDAIICADVVDRILELLEDKGGEADLPEAPTLTGFRFATQVAEARALATLLEDIPYRRFDLNADLGPGAKTGALSLLLPFSAGALRAGPEAGRAFTEKLAALVGETEVQLFTALARVTLPLSEVSALEPGQVLTLPAEVLGDVAIEDIAGDVVAHGRLGQAGGMRAIRIGAGPVGQDAPVGHGTAVPAVSDGPEAVPDLLPEPDMMPDPLDGAAELPALSDIPDLPDLADLPDLSEFGDLPPLDPAG